MDGLSKLFVDREQGIPTALENDFGVNDMHVLVL